MIKIDKLDRKIIAELDMNARMSMSELAKNVRSSREVVTYRLKVLTNKGIISGTHTFFNPSKLGYSLYRLLIRLDSLDKDIVKEFHDFFMKQNRIMWFARLGGKWDYVVEFFAKNANEADKLIETFIGKFKAHVKVYECMGVLSINCYTRKYIHDNNKEPYFSILGLPEKERLAEEDLEIIKHLKKNAQASNTEIANSLGVVRNTVKNRIKKLEERGVISGYKLVYHPSSLGYQSFKLLFSMKNLDSKKEKEFFSFAEQNPNIIFAHKNFGKWNYEFEIECKDVNELQNMIIETRVRFKDVIEDYEIFPVLYDYRIDTFPFTELDT